MLHIPAQCTAVVDAESGARFERGQIHVAVPGVHLLWHDHHILLRRGPRENLSRPSIDALFRSAAASLGSRVIGVLLSGSLSDGSVGLRAIERCGGVNVVQDPEDALVPAMPRSALRHARTRNGFGTADRNDKTRKAGGDSEGQSNGPTLSDPIS